MADQAFPANGPGVELAQGPPPWEKPMTTQDMRQRCDRWTLAGDAGLLNFLQHFSQRMISKTHEMEQILNSLDHEAKVTDTRVSNVMNDFHMLSNTQFVESRVYDEEVSDGSPKGSKPPEEVKTKEQREAELVAKVTSALKLGLTTLEHAFDKVELQEDSDSEEEDSIMKGGTILEARDPYLHRPLPLLIGTPGFFSDDYVGLQDVLSEEELSAEKEDMASDVSTESESEPELIAVTRPMAKDMSESGSGGSDLFPSGAEDGEYLSRSSSFSTGSEAEKVVNLDQTDRSQVAPPADALGPGLLADELENRLKKYTDKPVRTRESRLKSDTASIHSRSSRKSTSSRHSKKATPVKKAPSDEDLFGHPEEVNEEDEILFGRKGGLFSASGKLFDSQESGLFDEVPQTQPEPEEKLITPQTRGRTKSGKKIPSGAIAVLTDGDLFKSAKSQAKDGDQPDSKKVPEISKVEEAEPSPTPRAAKTPRGGLFDDSEDDDDDDLFGIASKPKSASKPSVPPAKKNTAPPKVITKAAAAPSQEPDLFASDEEGSDLFSVPTATPERMKVQAKKPPAGAVPIFGDLSKDIASTLKRHKDEDSDNSSDSGPGSSGGASGTAGASTITTPVPRKPSLGMKPSRSNSVSSNSLFAEDADTDDLFTATTTTSRRDSKISSKEPKKSFLFEANSDEDEEGLFSSQPSAPSRPQTVGVTTSSRNVSDLFDDLDDDNSLFAAVAKPPSSSQKTNTGLSLFEDKAPALKPKEEEPPKTEVKPKPAAAISEKKVSLFDDDDGDDLFSSGPSSRSMQSPGSLASESREDSVQSPTSPVMVSKKEEATDEVDTGIKKENEEEKKTRTTSLFDDEDLLFGGPPSESPEVDLFTAKQSDPPKEPRVAKASPVGGVSLFGGINPFAGAKSTRTTGSPKIAELSEALQSQNPASPPVSTAEEPKRAPMLKEIKEVSVSFDEPVDTSNTLMSAARDRAKGQAKRRPPSRKGRQAASRNSGVDFLNDAPTPATSDEQPEADKSKPPQTLPAVPLLQQEPSLPTLATDSVDSVPNSESTKSSTSKSESFLSVNKDLDLQSPSTEEEDLFSVGEPKKDTRLFMGNSGSGTGEHHNSFSKGKANKTVQDSSKSKKPSSNREIDIFASDEDDADIFSSPPTKKGMLESAKTSLQKNGDSSAKVDDLFGDDVGNDDIFAPVPSTRTEKKVTKNSQTSRSIFDDDGDEDDDDIFAPRPSAKSSQASASKQTTVRKSLKNSSSVDAFSDPLLSLQKDEMLK